MKSQARPRLPVALALTVLWTFAAALPTVVLAAEPADFAGHWEGAIEVPGSPLGVEVDLMVGEDGALTGDITIPRQGARDLPLGKLAVDGDAVTFAILGIPGDPTFRGTLAEAGTSLAGDFTQGGATLAFALERAEPPAESAKGALGDFADFVEDARVAWEVPGLAVAVVADGEVIFAQGFGHRNVEEELPVTPDTLFAIGSCTKAFTTFLLATLVDEGKLEWDQPVKSYLPGFQLYDETTTDLITPRDLVTHRSGLPRHDLLWYNNQSLPRGELVARLAHLPPTATLRQKYQYNNLMYLTAGHLAEVLTGKRWEENVRERIFEPLGMSRSVFTIAAMQADPDHALPYEEREDEVVRVPFRPIDNMGPAGSIDSSVSEMARWVTLHLAGGRFEGRRLVSEALVSDLHAPQMPTGASPDHPEITAASYASGWVADVYRGHPRVAHGGAIDGFIALVTLFPRDGIGIVALANHGGTPLPGLVTRHAADRLLDREPIDWNRDALARRAKGEEAEKEAEERKEVVRRPGTRPAHPLEEYAGRYQHPGYGPLEVVLAGDRLTLSYNAIDVPLEHWHYEVFSGAEGAEDPVFENMKFRFETGVRGYVAAVAAPFEPALGEIVFQRQPDAWMTDPRELARFVGRYELAGQVLTVALAGDTLTVSIPGQPLYHLEPALGGEFVLAEYSVVSLRFLTEDGEVTAIQVSQPEGVYQAERVDAES